MFDSEAIESLHQILQTEIKEITVAKPNGAEERYAIVPNGYRKELLYHRDALIPNSLKQKVSFDELEGFAAYLNRYGSSASTVIFLNQSETSISMRAVLDYHRPVEDADHDIYRLPRGQTVLQSFCTHEATFAPVETPEWKLWRHYNKRAMEQIAFAQFLEENRLDIAAPLAADLIELCRNLEIIKDVHYTKAYREQDGQTQLQYKEENKPNGRITIPDEILLRIVAYRGGPSVDLAAKLRYRLSDGTCSFFYDLVRPHKVLEGCVTEMRNQIGVLTDKKFPIYSGKTEG